MADEAGSTTELELLPQPRSPGTLSRRLAAVALGTAGVMIVAALHFRHGRVAAVREATKLYAYSSYTSPYAASASSDDTNTAFADTLSGLPGMPMMPQQVESQASSSAWTAPAPAPAPAESSDAPPTPETTPLPVVDSNDCRSNEEFFAGACYQNCSVLTAGAFTIRTSPNTCCSEEPCIFPSHFSYKGPFVCQGYAVDADGNCPRTPGKCDSNEEIYEGVCYKQCATLTSNAFPFRAGPNSCCKKEPPCWNVFNIKTEGGKCDGMAVGGGASGHECPHTPSGV
eukprot:TRINITY_DN1037_c2_g1_i1.p1 TRINITY_DN1037_c2_g1~~TRINITY_DN1037_c2_g1_i1.p1  ORF type:complete len:284 (+),score=38.24 TRINITY_DN1037_c2_g1_i1:70-921(+)